VGILREAHDFDLDAIFRSGQVFTWRPLEPASSGWGTGYLVSSGQRRCRVGQSGGTLALLDADGGALPQEDAPYWEHYFALDADYGAILGGLSLPHEVWAASAGIRVLAQDWWDTLVSFAISQNSNIPRIQHAMDALMAAGGGCVPQPAQLARQLSDDGFANALRLGYRLPYLQGIAQRCTAWRPSSLGSRPVALEEQLLELQSLPGVGPKVANCVCLFGLGYLDAVPRDTWIKKVESRENVAWDPTYGGIQQQYYFAWARERSHA
jgi:N-glycosylase/DNA lyase